MHKNSYFNVCKNLIMSDLLIFQQTFFDKFIDISIWIILTIFVTGYIMPYFGLADNFGIFQFGGVIAAVGLFEVYVSAVDLVADLQADRMIDYTLTLPIPSWLAIVSKAGYYFCVYVSLTIAVLPLGKILLWNQLDLMQVDYLKLGLSIVFQSAFCACFVIWTASIIEDLARLGSVWSRFIFPMWFMGGFQFSWTSLHHVVPVVAWIDLFNPMIYVTESTRAAISGQADYLNFWLCLGAIALFSCIFLYVGILNLKKRLDFVW
jgi:hypothetical protein